MASAALTKPYLRRKKCDVQIKPVYSEEDLVTINSPWDFFGEGPSGWCIAITTTCKHSYEVVGEVDEEDTTFREYFQCIYCKEKMSVQLTFGCPRCYGRHRQFMGICGSSYMLCPQNPFVPFLKSEIRGVQFEVYTTPCDD